MPSCSWKRRAWPIAAVRAGLVFAAAVLMPAGGAAGQAVAVENARVLTMDGREVESGTILIQNGRIAGVGPAVRVPPRAARIDARGMTVTPGLIDASGALAMTQARGGGDATQRAFDAFDRYATEQFRDALRHGVTALYIPAAGGRGINGVGQVVRLAPGDGPWGGVVLREDGGLCIDLGSGDGAVRRLQTFNSVRAAFRKAVEHRDAVQKYEEALEEYEKRLKERAEGEDKEADQPGAAQPARRPAQPAQRGRSQQSDEPAKPTEPAPDRASEVLLKAVDREVPVRVVAHRSADILNAVELAGEFGLELIVEGGGPGGSEAALVAGELAEVGARVVLWDPGAPAVQSHGRWHGLSSAGAGLSSAGVGWAIGTGHEDGLRTRFVLMNAQVAAGSTDFAEPKSVARSALEMVTSHAAGFLGVGDRIGRIARGMEADLVFWTGDPGEPGSRVQRVYVGGELVYMDESLTPRGEEQ